MSEEEIKDLVLQASALGARLVAFTGGEPSLLKEKLVRLLRFIKTETKISYARIVTNGKWATSAQRAREILESWQDAGLDEVNISCGEYHQEFVPISSVITAYKAACDLDFQSVVLAGEFLVEGKGRLSAWDFQKEIDGGRYSPEVRSPYTKRYQGMSCGSAMRYGRGKEFIPVEDVHFQPEETIHSVCQDVLSVITAHPNGNTTACCGIMVREESLLNIGNWREQRLEPMLREANQDIVLNWIRYLGLRDMKRWIQSKDPTLLPRTEYTCICDLCADIVYDRRCQEILVNHGHERAEDIVLNKVALDATVYGSMPFEYSPASEGSARP
jgi:hypothetical protein